MSPDDTCQCGDYRKQHRPDGRCAICAAGNAPWDHCNRFRLAGKSANPVDASLKVESRG